MIERNSPPATENARPCCGNWEHCQQACVHRGEQAMLSRVARSLVEAARNIPPEFSEVVNKEFWNMLNGHPPKTSPSAEAVASRDVAIRLVARAVNLGGQGACILDAPCVFCGYNGAGYWQIGTHSEACPFREVGGDASRADHITELANTPRYEDAIDPNGPHAKEARQRVLSPIARGAVEHLIYQVEHGEPFDRGVMLKALRSIAPSTARASSRETPLNCDRDPARWAREFMAAFKDHPQDAPELDEGWLIGWFANAMMCGEDTYRWKLEKEGRIVPSSTAMPIRSAHVYRDACGDARVAIRYADDTEDDRPATALEVALSAREGNMAEVERWITKWANAHPTATIKCNLVASVLRDSLHPTSTGAK